MTKLIVLFSGKRKSGKDYLTESLVKRPNLQDVSEIIRISEPIKAHWANAEGLDLAQLLSDGPYKEQYRKDMIKWSDAIRAETPEFFCREAFAKATRPIVIISDIRRRTDIQYFQQLAQEIGSALLRVRVWVDDLVRVERGWQFERGVDDVASECDLDAYTEWDVEIYNTTGCDLDVCLGAVLQTIDSILMT